MIFLTTVYQKGKHKNLLEEFAGDAFYLLFL